MDTKPTAGDKSVTVETCEATGGDVLVASVAPADVQPADVPAVEGTDAAATTAVAVGATSTAADHVVATNEGAVEEGSLSVPSSTPTDEPPANASLLKGTDEAPTAAATVGAERASADEGVAAGKGHVAQGRLPVASSAPSDEVLADAAV